VQDNIERFGGDPGNVTVLGQSAGGGSIAALLTMPAARGTFRRAILQSVPGTYFTAGLTADVSAEICAGRPTRQPRPAGYARQRWRIGCTDAALHLAEADDRGGARVWLYELCWGFGPYGASRGLDTLRVFGTADLTDDGRPGGDRRDRADHPRR
jgi:acetyl esterase/lipase